MSGGRRESARTALLIGHSTATDAGAGIVHAADDDVELDVLAYGRAAADLPAPAGARILPLPGRSPGAALRWLRELLGRRYDIAVVAQPHLHVSKARGALLAAAALSGAKEVRRVDLERGTLEPVRRRAALADGVRFALYQVLGRLVAELLGALLGPFARLAGGRSIAPEPPREGTVVYLRSDLDLALAPMTAGGSLAHTEGILRALHRRGHGVELWTTGEMAGMPAEVEVRALPSLLRANIPWELAELASGVLQAVHAPRPAERPAFVYQRYSMNNLAGLILARRWRVPFVLEANASEAAWREEFSVLDYPRLAYAVERMVLAGADRIAAVSDNAAVDLRRSSPDDGRLRIVPNGVEIERFAGAAARPLPFPDGSFVIAFCGLFYPWHGVRYLAEAFPRLLARHPDARLLLVGDGEDAPLARSLLAEQLKDGTAVLTGLVPRADVPGYMAAADVLVSPHAPNDDFIGSPIKLWEYMAAGRAIVATRVAQLGEVLRDRETAMLVTPGDPDAIADALSELHDDPELRARIGRAAGTEAAEHHSWDARLRTTLADA